MNGLNSGSQCASALTLLALMSGCMQSRVEESRELHTGIRKDEAVVILAKPQLEGASAEAQFIDCVAGGLAGDGAIATRTDEQFTDAMFPWFEPGTAPSRPEALAALLTRPGVAERVAESGVRYIVWLDGGTQKTDGGGSLACAGAPGAAGCIGFGWWEKESNYEATIWDLEQAKAAGTVATNVTGTSAIIGALIPVPFVSRVQGTACNRMASQLRTFLSGSDDTEPTRAASAQIQSASVPTLGRTSRLAAQTAEERRAALDKRLNDSLGSFDAKLRNEQQKIAQERDARQPTVPTVAASDSSGKADAGLTAEPPATAIGGDESTAGNGAAARELPDGNDDDVLARRLRKAAEQETDPELQDKLWLEYVEYKKNALGN